MLETFIFIAIALIGGSFCTSRAMKQLDDYNATFSHL